MVICPTGRKPQIVTVSSGSISHWTAACQPVGKMSLGNSSFSSGRPFGTLIWVVSCVLQASSEKPKESECGLILRPCTCAPRHLGLVGKRA